MMMNGNTVPFVLYHAEHEMYYENIYLCQLNLVFRS